MQDCSQTRARWRGVFMWLGALLLSVGIAISERLSSSAVGEKPYPLGLAIRRSLEEWIPWAILGLGVLWLARKTPLKEGRLGRWIMLHVFGSLVAVAIFAATYSLLLSGQPSLEGPPYEFGKVLKKVLIYHSHFSMLIYWMIVLVDHGIQSWRRYRVSERRTAELSAQLIQARLDALRMQINPHFLFNTLHSISALIHDNPQLADRMVVRLSELLRLTLERNDAPTVPLADELAFVQRYLEIEQARFGSRLAVEFDIAPETRRAIVPWLILQPLVENALRHGIEQMEEHGRLRLSARRAGDRLELAVTDNGPGLAEPSKHRRPGIGLANTRARLEHAFPGAHRLELVSVPGGGCEARLSIPFQSANEIEAHAR